MPKKQRKTAPKTVDYDAMLADAKAKLETELSEYALVRKNEVKDDILAAHKELHDLETAITAKKDELKELEAVYEQESKDFEVTRAEHARVIADSTDAVEVARLAKDKAEDDLRLVIYERDKQLQITDKAREEHDKFLSYERQARKILDDKDRELQSKAAEVTQANQFLRSRRSFLPEL